ncbi:hypothetical protein I2485_13305 [Nesterenkonia sp. E16_7]|uniref:hypothetical protein n=1 Tax=unclassified Nesterenkonia TaxID=2629769 RepID=UPI001A91CB8C|nr:MULTISPECIES: hypothetical protein [unclassified Nesterenkonia]MBO0595781.1 hypothetical protein [Nesterenkonia sp. E16_10]MBO0599620.1 hypothetical protein [Nesterenkonia sp. E16_7]
MTTRPSALEYVRDALIALAVLAGGIAIFGSDITISRNPVAGVLLMLAGVLLIAAVIFRVRRTRQSLASSKR